jgi:hypothetical protein
MDFLNQQFNRQQQPPRQRTWWEQTARARMWFLIGLVVGALFGWFFHGVVSLVIRLGFFILLLIPIAILFWLFVRSRRPPQEQSSGPRVFTIGGNPFGSQAPAPPPSRSAEPVIDLNEEDYDLEAFKRKLERDN